MDKLGYTVSLLLRKYSTSIPIGGGSIRRMRRVLERMENRVVKYRKISYKGSGRPRNSDYIMLKVKDIPDYRATEILHLSFRVSPIMIVSTPMGNPLFSDPLGHATA